MKQKKCDVVVIGTGMGALGAAGTLTAAGYKTIMLEKLNVLGGRFSTREYEGFKCPTCAAGIEMGGVIEEVWKGVKADFPVAQAQDLHYWIEGKVYDIPSKSGVRALLSILDKVEGEKAKIVGHMAKEVAIEKMMGAFKRGITGEEKVKREESLKDWLLKYTQNQRVLDVFQGLVIAMHAVNSWEYPASEFFAYISKTGGGGYRNYGYARYGNLSVVEALAKAMRAAGTEILINTTVKRIIVEGGQAKGVVADTPDGEVEFLSQAVISDIGPKETAAMAQNKGYTKEYLTRMEKDVHSIPGVAIFAASDKPLTDTPGALLVVGAKRICLCLQITILCPDIAPKGKHFLVTWGAPLDCRIPMDGPKEVELCVQDLRNTFPEFNKSGRLLRANVHQIGDEWPLYRAWAGYDMPKDTPVPNLFTVGDGNKPVGKVGLPGCCQVGKDAALAVKKMFKPKLG